MRESIALRSAQRAQSFKQCAGLVPARLPAVCVWYPVDMWLNKRWNSQTAFGIKHFALR